MVSGHAKSAISRRVSRCEIIRAVRFKKGVSMIWKRRPDYLLNLAFFAPWRFADFGSRLKLREQAEWKDINLGRALLSQQPAVNYQQVPGDIARIV